MIKNVLPFLELVEMEENAANDEDEDEVWDDEDDYDEDYDEETDEDYSRINFQFLDNLSQYSICISLVSL